MHEHEAHHEREDHDLLELQHGALDFAVQAATVASLAMLGFALRIILASVLDFLYTLYEITSRPLPNIWLLCQIACDLSPKIHEGCVNK